MSKIDKNILKNFSIVNKPGKVSRCFRDYFSGKMNIIIYTLQSKIIKDELIDVENTAKLIACFVRSLSDKTDFVPR